MFNNSRFSFNGQNISENNLEESNLVMQITSKLIINKIAYKLMNDDITKIICNKFKGLKW